MSPGNKFTFVCVCARTVCAFVWCVCMRMHVLCMSTHVWGSVCMHVQNWYNAICSCSSLEIHGNIPYSQMPTQTKKLLWRIFVNRTISFTILYMHCHIIKSSYDENNSTNMHGLCLTHIVTLCIPYFRFTILATT